MGILVTFYGFARSARLLILTEVLVFLVKTCVGVQCSLKEDVSIAEFNDTSGASLRRKVGLLSCPGPGDPSDYTECCWDSRFQCCPSQRPIYQVDDRMVMVVGLTVICSCLILTVAIVVCCFWGRCPLYNTCRVNYTQGDVIAYAKDDDPLNGIMPPEDKGGQHQYAPNAVKIKPVEDV
ncbi:uncharacterized protein [Anabrus simplex]|uniref:uncharacterized protein n=1 Tax=Anabrus simplex TaxID=316456 RepID=UPI0035A3C230